MNAVVALKQELSTETVAEIARAAFDKHKDHGKATDAAFAEVMGNRALYKATCNDLLRDHISLLVGDAMRTIRYNTFQSIRARAPEQHRNTPNATERIKCVHTATKRLLLDLPLSKGPLRNYTRLMLREESQFYGKQAATMRQRALFFDAIWSRMSDNDTTVKDVFDENELQTLHDVTVSAA